MTDRLVEPPESWKQGFLDGWADARETSQERISELEKQNKALMDFATAYLERQRPAEGSYDRHVRLSRMAKELLGLCEPTARTEWEEWEENYITLHGAVSDFCNDEESKGLTGPLYKEMVSLL